MRSLVVVSAIAVCVSTPAAAVRLLRVVPTDFSTIQAAIDASAPGTTIVVRGGVYEEALLIKGAEDLVIEALGTVFIDAEGEGTPLRIRSSEDIRIEGLTLVRPQEHAVAVFDSEDVTLDELKVRGETPGDGVHVENTDDFRLRKSTIRKTGGPCVSVEDSDDVEISGNKLLRCGDNGIDAEGNDVQIKRNTVKQPEGLGIHLLGDDGSIGRNAVEDSQDEGVLVEGSRNRIRRNDVEDPERSGISIVGNRNRVDKNTVRRSGRNGFEIDGSRNRIERNTSRRSEGDGAVDLAGEGANDYTDNAFDSVVFR